MWHRNCEVTGNYWCVQNSRSSLTTKSEWAFGLITVYPSLSHLHITTLIWSDQYLVLGTSSLCFLPPHLPQATELLTPVSNTNRKLAKLLQITQHFQFMQHFFETFWMFGSDIIAAIKYNLVPFQFPFSCIKKNLFRIMSWKHQLLAMMLTSSRLVFGLLRFSVISCCQVGKHNSDVLNNKPECLVSVLCYSERKILVLVWIIISIMCWQGNYITLQLLK